MARRLHVLFSSAGRRVALVRAFRRSLERLGVEHRLVSADMKRNAPAGFVVDTAELVPRVTAPGYLDAMAEICERHRIDLVVPLIDPELPVLATARGDFASRGTTLLLSDPASVAIGADKRDTHAFFVEAGIDTPAILDFDEVLADDHAAYPFLVKPADGSSSVGVTVVRDRDELAFYRPRVRNAILQELVRGQEYTLDVLADFEGRVRCVVPRARIETLAGEVSKGVTERHPAIVEGGRRVVEAMPGARGCITVQCFLTPEGDVRFIEINPRFGGGFPLSYEAGADFPGWICQWLLGEDPAIDPEAWRDGLVMLRYHDAVFVDRDRIS